MKSICLSRKLLVSLFLFWAIFISVANKTYAQASCASPVALTQGSTCTTTTGNLRNAVGATPAPTCGSGTAYSVWYTFTATSTKATVTINNFGSNITGSFIPYIQIFSGTCAGLTSIACVQAGSTTGILNTSSLTIGVVYYIRVYTTTQGTASPTNKWDFNICVQIPPANDDCSNATSLTSAATCANTAGTLSGSQRPL